MKTFVDDEPLPLAEEFPPAHTAMASDVVLDEDQIKAEMKRRKGARWDRAGWGFR